MTDPEPVQRICRVMAERVLYIADGHHRYETALAYRDACRRQGNGSGNEAFQYILMYIANMEAPGITILPFHRILGGLNDFHPEQFLAHLADRYQLEEWPAANRREALPEFLALLRQRGQDSHTFGLGLPREERFFICSITRSQAAAIAGKLAPVVKQLDVTVLHELILRDLLRVRTDSLKQQRHVSYIPSARKALAALDQDPSQVGFWLNPTRIQEVRAVAQERETMPQKSTYFYPKPITGLVINPLHVPETIEPPDTKPGLVDVVGGEAQP